MVEEVHAQLYIPIMAMDLSLLIVKQLALFGHLTFRG